MRTLYPIFLICCLLICLPAIANNTIEAQKPTESKDNGFGAVDLSKLPEEGKQYLGLRDGVKPILANVEADLIVFEFMNIHCHNCQVQTLIFNKLYRAIENDPVLRSRAKMISIGAGNSVSEVEQFKKDLKAVFPILIDPEFVVYESLAGSIKAPYTVMLRRNEEGDLILAASHRGAIPSYTSYLAEMKVVMQYDENILELRRAERAADEDVERTELKLSEAELVTKVRGRMIKISGDEDIFVAFKPVPLRGNPKICEKVYEGRSGDTRYFAAIVNREPVCDVCHAAQFIYIFDEKGKVVDFEPIYLTKGDNETWNEEDIEKTRKGLVGKSILQPANFNPEVDAVTSATITSAIIFHAISQGRNILRRVR
jgi:hypothetical protein